MKDYQACPASEDCIIDNCTGYFRLDGRKAIAKYDHNEHECSRINVISPQEAKRNKEGGLARL